MVLQIIIENSSGKRLEIHSTILKMLVIHTKKKINSALLFEWFPEDQFNSLLKLVLFSSLKAFLVSSHSRFLFRFYKMDSLDHDWESGTLCVKVFEKEDQVL